MDRRDDDASPPDYYVRLGVRPSALPQQIREAYREKAQETHPDHNAQDPEAVHRFRQVKEAYHVLSDPGRRREYDAHREDPESLYITHEASVGCRGYLWRVLAGVAAVALFFLLEAFDVWAASETWTIVVAVGLASLGAALVAVLAARHLPDDRADVSVHISPRRARMWADGRLVVALHWDDVESIRLGGKGPTLTLVVDSKAVPQIPPIPPVLCGIDRKGEHTELRFDLSDTDVRPGLLRAVLRDGENIPFSPSTR